jgi:hypothetical protein
MDVVDLPYLKKVLALVDSHKLTALKLPGIEIQKPSHPGEPPKPLNLNTEPTTIEELDAEIEATLKHGKKA